MKVIKRTKLKPLNSVRLSEDTVKDLFGRLMVITYKDMKGQYCQRRYLLCRDELNLQKFKTLPMKGAKL